MAIDHPSRLIVGYAVFPRRPATFAVCSFLKRAMLKVGTRPKHIISDKGKEFFCRSFRRLCRRRGIKPRYGAVGKHGSIAVIERFIRSMKNEATRKALVPLNLDKARKVIGLYVAWYNLHRPHQALDGSTPAEVYGNRQPANEAHRFEPRSRWPLKSRCAKPTTKIKGERGVKLELHVSHFEGRRHLPVIELKPAA